MAGVLPTVIPMNGSEEESRSPLYADVDRTKDQIPHACFAQPPALHPQRGASDPAARAERTGSFAARCWQISPGARGFPDGTTHCRSVEWFDTRLVICYSLGESFSLSSLFPPHTSLRAIVAPLSKKLMSDPDVRLQELVRKFNERGHRMTPQRMAVLRILADSDGHPSLQRIYDQVKLGFSMTSLGTIYDRLPCSRRWERSWNWAAASDGMSGNGDSAPSASDSLGE
jgi:hypothetical protein